jgi:hypothetical protein
MNFWNFIHINNIKFELKLVWTIISVVSIFFFVSLFVFDKNNILDFSPICKSVELYNVECLLCGMTRAFIKCSEFRFTEAYKLNNGSIFLYTLLLFNSLFFITKTIFFKFKISNQ